MRFRTELVAGAYTAAKSWSMAKNESENAAAHQPFLDPKEWDFRFMEREHMWTVVVYEYARTCGWVRDPWERLLARRVPGTVSSDGSSKCVRDVIRDHFQLSDPIWAGSSQIAKHVMALIPDVLKKASLTRLICCVPSFPAVPWCDLPHEEKTAALNLCSPAMAPFRDAKKPIWSSRQTFTVAIDFDARPKDLRRAVKEWLAAKTLQFSGTASSGSKTWRKVNKGRNPHAMLSWLGVYRLDQAGFKYTSGIAAMHEQIKLRADPVDEEFPQLFTDGMEPSDWSRWKKMAEWKMIDLFHLKDQRATSPHPRWKVKKVI